MMEKSYLEAGHRVELKHELKRKGIPYDKNDTTENLEKLGEMLEKEFTYDTRQGWGGVFSQIIAWVNFPCPYCGKYYSENFLFVPEKGKTEYIGTCKKCGKDLRIKINILTNNAMVKQQELNLLRIQANGNESLLKWAIE